MPPLVRRHQGDALSQCEFDQSVSRRFYSGPAEVNAVGVAYQTEQPVLKSHELRHNMAHRYVGGRREASKRFELYSHRRLHRANHQRSQPGMLVRPLAEPALYPRPADRVGQDRQIEPRGDVKMLQTFVDRPLFRALTPVELLLTQAFHQIFGDAFYLLDLAIIFPQ